jgi:hypothetical protein
MYDSYGDYSGSNNMGTAFLESNMQSAYSTNMQQSSSFGAVMSTLAGSVNQSASMGVMPGANNGELSPQQMAAQMQVGGPMSVLPYLGGGAVQKLIFPIAGLWSLVDGVKAVGQMRKETAGDSASYKRFNPDQLSYNRASRQMDEMQTEYNYY